MYNSGDLIILHLATPLAIAVHPCNEVETNSVVRKELRWYASHTMNL